MKTAHLKIIMLTFLLTMTQGVLAGNNAISSKFNFSYALEGDADIAPSQAFDDGNKIFLQFSQLSEIPNFFHDDGQGKASAQSELFEVQSPYIVINKLVPRLHLSLGPYHAVLVNQNMKQAKGTVSIARTIGAIFSSKQNVHGEETETQESIKMDTTKNTNPLDQSAQGHQPFIFQVRDREILSLALRNFLDQQGWRLQWNTPHDFMIHSAYVLYGKTLTELIRTLLSEYQLQANYSGNLVIVSTQSNNNP
jgi:Conjugal transfer protein